MARAAAKRRPRPKAEAHRERGHSGSGARAEQTLFFQRIRKQAKWVFVFLAFVFAGSFVVYGVGSGSTGIGDLLRGNFGGLFGGGSSSGSPSIDKARKRIAKNPKDAQAYRDLARALEQKNRNDEAIGALESYTRLRPKEASALRELAAVYDTRARAQTEEARAAAYEYQTAQGTSFGAAPGSKLGQALASHPDSVEQAVTQSANQRYNAALSRLQSTFRAQEQVFAKIVRLDPADSTTLLQYADSAQRAGDNATALKSYARFLRLFPDDPSAAYARQQAKALRTQVSATSGG